MDEIAIKSVVIGVSIFVTLLIFTVIIFEYAEITNLYKQTGEINTTFEKQMDEFNKYKDENNEFVGLDVENAVKKYKEDSTVDVCVGEVDQKCNDEITINKSGYKEKYKSKFIDNNGMYKIVFIKK